jgi:beta-glucanase (GH16 family)
MTPIHVCGAGARILTLAVLGALAVAGCGAGTASDYALPPASAQRLIFSDDFSGDSLGDAWTTCYWWQVDGGCTIASNDEEQWYRPEAVEVTDDMVILTATDDPQLTTDGSTLPFRSGVITTGHADNDVDEPGFAFTYGRVEARVRFPDGEGTWPAVWLLSADRTSLPEIDIMEWYGARETVITSHVHQRVDGEAERERVDTIEPDIAGEWHEVGVEWSPDLVEFFFDGRSIGSVDDPDLVPSTPMYLIANLALGGPAGEVDTDALPQTFAIDWIRVWQ